MRGHPGLKTSAEERKERRALAELIHRANNGDAISFDRIYDAFKAEERLFNLQANQANEEEKKKDSWISRGWR